MKTQRFPSEGGSYTRDPATGEFSLVNRTGLVPTAALPAAPAALAKPAAPANPAAVAPAPVNFKKRGK